MLSKEELKMEERRITAQQIQSFRQYLIHEEKSTATLEKYLRDVRAFSVYAGNSAITKETVLAYKQHLLSRGYAVRSINSMLASVHSLLNFLGWNDCRVKFIRQQRQVYCAAERELTRSEYLRLLEAARSDQQLYLVLQTICATGIRVSELGYFTLERVRRGEISVNCKGKIRTILIPSRLRGLLLRHARARKITAGPIFRNTAGRPLSRTIIWAKMKALCRAAGVNPAKVFPHNLRKLFARTFYGLEKDIAKLADILGHSSIDTTRLYIISTGTEHRRKIERLGLVI